jgi:formamidopyrimidine-DNA glycosylase
MPEGPEVKTIAEQLAGRVTNRTLLSVNVHGGRYEKSPLKGLKRIDEWTPLGIIGAGCHGKFLFFIMEAEWFLWCSLGMTGTWTETFEKHSHVELVLNDGSIFFTDPRRFGTLKFVKGKEEMISKLKSLGPDMLSSPPNENEFIRIIRSRGGKDIVQALMDQATLAGVGNYIKSESLYRARISPYRKCDDLSDQELISLRQGIIDVMTESYSLGGNTIRDYKGLDGAPGTFADKLQVYNQDEDPQGNEVIKESTADKRSTFWVPALQT